LAFDICHVQPESKAEMTHEKNTETSFHRVWAFGRQLNYHLHSGFPLSLE